MLRLRASFLLLPLFLAACLPETTGQSGTVDEPRLTPAEITACTAAGGRVGIAGLMGGQVCFPRAGDAGQACTRSSDCEGLCMAETSTCQDILSPFGCQSFLDDDGQVRTICVD